MITNTWQLKKSFQFFYKGSRQLSNVTQLNLHKVTFIMTVATKTPFNIFMLSIAIQNVKKSVIVKNLYIQTFIY